MSRNLFKKQHRLLKRCLMLCSLTVKMIPTARKLPTGSLRCTLTSWWLEDMRKDLIIPHFPMIVIAVMMECWLCVANFTACAATIISQWSELPISGSLLHKSWSDSASALESHSGVQEEERFRKSWLTISWGKSRWQLVPPIWESISRPLTAAAKTGASWRIVPWPKLVSWRAHSRQTLEQRLNSSITSSYSKTGQESDHSIILLSSIYFITAPMLWIL